MSDEISDHLEDAPSNWGTWGEDDHCAADGQYDVSYVDTPLKIVRATGSPVNSIAIR